jgi:hypothetical protein
LCAQLRAAVGASVSFADMMSDAYMINIFFVTGREGAAEGLLAMVLINLLWQVLIVYVKAVGLKKNKWRTLLFEVASVVSFVKPGLDAYRVASGAENLPGSSYSPLTEMTLTKAGELVFEAVPGLLLQLVALVNATAEERTFSAFFSIFVSTASTALTATTIFWDIDTDPAVRKRNPVWCGIVPDLNRTRAFAVVFLMCACQIVAKAAATALLLATNSTWALIYLVGDHVLHFVYRFVRRDVFNFFASPPAASYAMAFAGRIVNKVLTDFTGCPNFRLPLMNGGAYWLFSLFVSQVSVLVSVFLYDKFAVVPEDGRKKIDAATLWRGAFALTGGWACIFGFFVLKVAVPKYRHTLWSWTTGRQCVQDYFYRGKDAEAKFEFFGCNLLLWESDIGAAVKAWAAVNWGRWQEEKPEWFKVELVPDRFIPAGELAQLGHNWMRRGWAAGSVWECFREVVGGVGE